MCGTAAEVTPIRSVDDLEIGPPGPVTRELQETYWDVVKGRRSQWLDWLDLPARTPAQA
jgi:branched-chain amino acid aminotransferase